MLDENQKSTLMAAAREALNDAVRGRPERIPSTRDAELLRPRDVFVTLMRDDALRGCVGVPDARRPLIESVARCAIAAGLEDARFEPVTESELQSIKIEISIPSPPRPIAAPHEVRIGLDGVIVDVGGRKGLLLPQVAVQQGWNGDELVAAACRKAGLSAAAWRQAGATMLAFTAEVFREER